MATQQFDLDESQAMDDDRQHDQQEGDISLSHDVSMLDTSLHLPALSDQTVISQKTYRQLTLAQESQADPANTFRILVASDVHLGYADRDEIRKNDSFNTFEEVLKIAKAKQVDFVLLGGDLFHDNKPSRFTAQQCATLLRTYCMGESHQGANFKVVSDPDITFAHVEPGFRRVNTDDPDLKISLPVYSIHGNHDDPSGLKYLSELDLLHTYGLINYFGKATDVEKIEINPLLFTKGSTKLAVYGLGSIRDERLHRAYLTKSVKMIRPTEDPESLFSMFLIHQNRPSYRGHTNYIPESFLDNWLDLVVWGHEHDPIPAPEFNKETGFEVLQPGSTVATSMSDGEGKQKFCYVLSVCETKYKVEPIPLDTVRPFYIDEVDLVSAGYTPNDANAAALRHEIETFLDQKVEGLLSRAERERKPSQPKEPLIRLRVDFGEIDPLNPILFGQKFFGRVANPRDIILPLKSKVAVEPVMNGVVTQAEKKPNREVVLDTTSIEDLAVEHLSQVDGGGLSLFEPKLLSEALRRYVHSDDRDVLDDIYAFQKRRVFEFLTKQDKEISDLNTLNERLREFRSNCDENASKFMGEFASWRKSSAPRSLVPPLVKTAAPPRAAAVKKEGVKTEPASSEPQAITIDDDDDEGPSSRAPASSHPTTTTFRTQGGATFVVVSKRSVDTTPPPAKRARGGGPGRPRGRPPKRGY